MPSILLPKLTQPRVRTVLPFAQFVCCSCSILSFSGVSVSIVVFTCFPWVPIFAQSSFGQRNKIQRGPGCLEVGTTSEVEVFQEVAPANKPEELGVFGLWVGVWDKVGWNELDWVESDHLAHWPLFDVCR